VRRVVACLLLFLAPGAAPADDASHAPTRRTETQSRGPSDVPARPLQLALEAFACARSRGLFEDDSTLTLIDYSRPSTEPRLWVLDARTGAVRFRELVAHGRASGENQARHFSNREGSRQSSLGLFRTAETYHGRHGYSLRLDGLEPGVNDRARARAIVMHGADYATPAFSARFGRLGRSWGCPALDPAVHREVIDTIRGGTAVFAYYPDEAWLAESAYLNCSTETAHNGTATDPSCTDRPPAAGACPPEARARSEQTGNRSCEVSGPGRAGPPDDSIESRGRYADRRSDRQRGHSTPIPYTDRSLGAYRLEFGASTAPSGPPTAPLLW